MSADSRDLQAIGAALAGGTPVSDADLLAAAASTDILGLAMLADDVRRRRHGATVTYVRVANVALPLEGEPVVVPKAAREIRVTPADGGLDEQLRGLRAVVAAAGGVPVTACSLAALEASARAGGRSLLDAGAMLRDCGVSAVSEAPIDQLEAPEAAFETIRRAGLEIARVTVSRNTDAAGRVAILRRLEAVQRSSGSVRSFAPLARSWNAAAPSTGYEDVRHVAVARLFLAEVPTIQVDWALYGPKLAQVALTMGADDLDAVSALDDMPDGRRRAPLEEVLRNIRAAAFEPLERDARYRPIGA